jgi:hypothetical protein
MALNRYVLTATVTLPPGTFTADAATGFRFGTGSSAQGAGVYGSGGPGVSSGAAGTVFPVGTVIVADPAGALFTAIGSGNLRAYVQGQDDVGHAALSN